MNKTKAQRSSILSSKRPAHLGVTPEHPLRTGFVRTSKSIASQVQHHVEEGAGMACGEHLRSLGCFGGPPCALVCFHMCGLMYAHMNRKAMTPAAPAPLCACKKKLLQYVVHTCAHSFCSTEHCLGPPLAWAYIIYVVLFGGPGPRRFSSQTKVHDIPCARQMCLHDFDSTCKCSRTHRTHTNHTKQSSENDP